MSRGHFSKSTRLQPSLSATHSRPRAIKTWLQIRFAEKTDRSYRMQVSFSSWVHKKQDSHTWIHYFQPNALRGCFSPCALAVCMQKSPAHVAHNSGFLAFDKKSAFSSSCRECHTPSSPGIPSVKVSHVAPSSKMPVGQSSICTQVRKSPDQQSRPHTQPHSHSHTHNQPVSSEDDHLAHCVQPAL